MGGETHDDDAPECAVGVPIAATVEAMATGGLSGGRRQRCHAAEVRERTLRAKSFRIVAGSHEHGSGDVGTNTLERAERRCRRQHQPIQVTVQHRHLGGEHLMALRQALEGQLDRGCNGGDRTRTQARCRVDQAVMRERAHLLTQLCRRGDDQRLHLLERVGAHLHRRAPRDPERADHADVVGVDLGKPSGFAREHRPSRSLSINGVRLAARVPGLAVGAAHLNDRAAGSDEKPGQASAVRAGAFDAEARVAAKAVCPLQQAAVPRRRGRDGRGVRVAGRGRS